MHISAPDRAKVLPSCVLAVFLASATPAAARCQDDPAVRPDTCAPGPELRSVHTLPELPLGVVLERALHHSIANDRCVLLGGTGTDLWHGPDDAKDEFWMLCDRGPNGTVTVDNAVRRTFLVPDYTPLILRVQATADTLSLLDVIPLVGTSSPVGGLCNIEGHDEVPYDATGKTTLAYNPSGLDCEGMVRTRRGDFWLAEEYGPSLVHVDAGGRVRERFVPSGLSLPGADYPVTANLPAILARRRDNRGFEGLALSVDQTTLFAVLQSPLSIPDKATGEASRQVRILAFDVVNKTPAAEYLYRLDASEEFDPKTPARRADMKVSALAVVDADTILVLERTDVVARIFAASLRGAADLLGTQWDDPAHGPSLESLPEPAAAGVQALAKRLVVDLTALPGVPGKIEGIAILDAQTLAFANDNDFDVGTIDPAGNNVGKGTRSRLWVVRLPAPLR
jgi:hypothetical protein